MLGRDHLEIRTTPGGTVYYRDYERPFEPGVSKADNLLLLAEVHPRRSVRVDGAGAPSSAN